VLVKMVLKHRFNSFFQDCLAATTTVASNGILPLKA
jgi:hypothetical protein